MPSQSDAIRRTETARVAESILEAGHGVAMVDGALDDGVRA
ncbi:hypothetical protein [Natrinema pellirubrum]|nr:hypothetical protein [Natrinema pellirubrum]